jgi:uncharacterized protein YodC (DUF2158 family)
VEKKPSPATFEAHGKTWTRHTPGDPMPCDGGRTVVALLEDHDIGGTIRAGRFDWGKRDDGEQIIGWRYADEATPEPLVTKPDSLPKWTPTVGDRVQLKSGGPVMTVMTVEGDQCRALWHEGGEVQAFDFFNACLKPAKEEQP